MRDATARRNALFFKVSKVIVAASRGLSGTESRLLGWLAVLTIGAETEFVPLSVETLAQTMGNSEPAVRSAIRGLHRAGAIRFTEYTRKESRSYALDYAGIGRLAKPWLEQEAAERKAERSRIRAAARARLKTSA